MRFDSSRRRDGLSGKRSLVALVTGAAAAITFFIAGCDETECVRHSDCDPGYYCNVLNRCDRIPDGGADLALPDGGGDAQMDGGARDGGGDDGTDDADSTGEDANDIIDRDLSVVDFAPADQAAQDSATPPDSKSGG